MCTYIYIYIYGERERERERYTYTHVLSWQNKIESPGKSSCEHVLQNTERPKSKLAAAGPRLWKPAEERLDFHRWNRNRRPKPQKFSKLVFLITNT